MEQKKQENRGFPVNRKLEKFFLCAGDKNWSWNKGKEKEWMRKLILIIPFTIEKESYTE